MSEFTAKATALYESGLSLAEVAKELNSSRAWVSRKLRKASVKLRPKTGTIWSAEESEILRENFMLDDDALAVLLVNRSLSSIRNRRKSLGLVKYPDKVDRIWTPVDYQTIEDNAHITDYALSKIIGASANSVKCARLRAGIEKNYVCRVCNTAISQQGNFCKAHSKVGRQLRTYSSKAMIKGREFALSEQYTYSLLLSACTYCGGDGGGIDRIDSSIGYVEDNVVPCCRRCNVMKSDMSLDAFREHTRKLVAHMGQTNV